MFPIGGLFSQLGQQASHDFPMLQDRQIQLDNFNFVSLLECLFYFRL